MLSESFGHRDQNICASLKELTRELCRWMEDTPATPTRKVRAGTGVSEIADKGLQERLDPVDILTQLKDSGFWEGVKAAGWSERKDAVVKLTNLASAKRIAPGNFDEVSGALRELIRDENILVTLESIKAIENLALGLGSNFSECARSLLPILLKKLEESELVSNSLRQTLQVIHTARCIRLADLPTVVSAAIEMYRPHVCTLILHWAKFCIERSSKPVIRNLHKDFVLICMKSLRHQELDVKKAMLSVLVELAKTVGTSTIVNLSKNLDDVSKHVFFEMVSSAEVGISVGSTPARSPTAAETHDVVINMDRDSFTEGKNAAELGQSPIENEVAISLAMKQSRLAHAKVLLKKYSDYRSSELVEIDSTNNVAETLYSAFETTMGRFSANFTLVAGIGGVFYREILGSTKMLVASSVVLTLMFVLVGFYFYRIYIRLYHLKIRRANAIKRFRGFHCGANCNDMKFYLSVPCIEDTFTFEEEDESAAIVREYEALLKRFNEDEQSFDRDRLNSNPFVIVILGPVVFFATLALFAWWSRRFFTKEPGGGRIELAFKAAFGQ